MENTPKHEKTDKEIESEIIKSIQKKENPSLENLQNAEKINFNQNELLQTDQYGFIKSDADQKQEDLLKINARLEKWNTMIKDFDGTLKNNFNKIKERTRKGIPDSLRACVWQKFAEYDKYYIKDLYKNLENEKSNLDYESVILKDLDRTFPQQIHFKTKYGTGQRSLYRVLCSYSKYNKEIGYVQGMGFIAALLLTYMDEEGTFFMMESLMKKYELEGLYKPGFPVLKKIFYVFLNLMKKYLPKIYELFKKNEILPSMYASEWFICIFSRDLKFDVLVRIFDCFLLEKKKILYRFALAFIKNKEKEFLSAKDGILGIMNVFKTIFENVNVEDIIHIAFNFNFKRKNIKKYEDEYEKVKDDKNNEFIYFIY